MQVHNKKVTSSVTHTPRSQFTLTHSNTHRFSYKMSNELNQIAIG